MKRLLNNKMILLLSIPLIVACQSNLPKPSQESPKLQLNKLEVIAAPQQSYLEIAQTNIQKWLNSLNNTDLLKQEQ